MPVRQGKCIDFGACALADKRELIQIPDGAEFVCPECGRALQEVRGKSQAWLQPEIEAAAELRATLMSLLLAKASGESAK